MADFYHRTNNIDALASSGRIKALKHLAKDLPDLEIEVESKAGGRNFGGLRSSRETLRASDAYDAMKGVKDVDNVFLTKDTVASDSYGKYVVHKELESPTMNRKLNLIANEYITPRALSLKHKATVYAPGEELSDLASKYSGIKFRDIESLEARGAGLLDVARSLGAKAGIVKTSSASLALGALGAAAMAYKSRDSLLGYHNVYHGTSAQAAESIRKSGLDPNWGGTGASAVSGRDDFVDQSKNKVHYTKLRNVAEGYANTVDEGGAVLEAYIPHKQWEESEVDPDARWGLNTSKRVAATTTEAITPDHLKAKAKDYLNRDNLLDYYGSSSGRGRAAAALAAAAGTGAGLTLAARKLAKI